MIFTLEKIVNIVNVLFHIIANISESLKLNTEKPNPLWRNSL